ncbi:MAG: hypothetical protein ACERKD_05285 [Prolixibacteraceae bacterium]
MATYSIKINEKTKTGKHLLNLLQSMNDVVTLTPQSGSVELEQISKEELLSDLKQSISEAKNKHTKPLKELING